MAEWRIAASTASKELLAEAVTSPSTSAVRVAMSPMPSFIVSRDSSVRWCGGSTARRVMPATMPARVQASAITLMTVGFIEFPAPS